MSTRVNPCLFRVEVASHAIQHPLLGISAVFDCFWNTWGRSCQVLACHIPIIIFANHYHAIANAVLALNWSSDSLSCGTCIQGTDTSPVFLESWDIMDWCIVRLELGLFLVEGVVERRLGHSDLLSIGGWIGHDFESILWSHLRWWNSYLLIVELKTHLVRSIVANGSRYFCCIDRTKFCLVRVYSIVVWCYHIVVGRSSILEDRETIRSRHPIEVVLGCY